MKFKKPDSLKLSTKTLKLTRRNAFILALVLAAIALVIFGFLSSSKKSPKEAKVDCAAFSKHADDLLSQNKYKETYTNLNTVAQICAKAPDGPDLDKPAKTQQFITAININGNLAISAYGSGYKNQAKVYAEQGLKIRKQMTSEQENTIPPDQRVGFNKTLIALYKIQKDVYYVDMSTAQ